MSTWFGCAAGFALAPSDVGDELGCEALRTWHMYTAYSCASAQRSDMCTATVTQRSTRIKLVYGGSTASSGEAAVIEWGSEPSDG